MEEDTGFFVYGIGVDKSHEELQALADSLKDISLRNIKRWVKGETVPIGINAVNLRFGLRILGYKIKEVDNLSKLAQKLGETYIKSDITFDDLSIKLDIPKRKLMDFLLGKIVVSSERNARIINFIDSREKTIQEVEENIPPPPILKEPIDQTSVDSDIEMFIYLLNEIGPLAERILSDEVSPEDRRKMRETLGRDRLFKISNQIDCLCSERAREKLIKENRGRR